MVIGLGWDGAFLSADVKGCTRVVIGVDRRPSSVLLVLGKLVLGFG
jgi:hypothetical protein